MVLPRPDRDERGDTRGRRKRFFAPEISTWASPVPWTLTPETFAHTVQRAITALDEQYRSFLRTEEVFVADVPGVEVVADGLTRERWFCWTELRRPPMMPPPRREYSSTSATSSAWLGRWNPSKRS